MKTLILTLTILFIPFTANAATITFTQNLFTSDGNATHFNTAAYTFSNIGAVNAFNLTNMGAGFIHGALKHQAMQIDLLSDGSWVNIFTTAAVGQPMLSTIFTSPISFSALSNVTGVRLDSRKHVNQSYNFIDGNMKYELTSMGQVPVPAAVWLMGSGLLGVLGFGRRNKAQAVAA